MSFWQSVNGSIALALLREELLPLVCICLLILVSEESVNRRLPTVFMLLILQTSINQSPLLPQLFYTEDCWSP